MQVKFINKKQVAETLGVSARSIDRLVARGDLKKHKVLGAVRFLLSDVHKLMGVDS